MKNNWKNLSPVPLDPIFALDNKYKLDPRDEKFYLAIGLYFDPKGNPVVFDSIQKSAKNYQTENYNYFSMMGYPDFLKSVGSELLGKNFKKEKTILQQTCGGTHACSLFSKLLSLESKDSTIYIGTPTWGNHFELFPQHKIEKFDHLEGNFASVQNHLDVIKKLKPQDVLLLHGGKTHNPTGQNLDFEQLNKLIPEIQKSGATVYIDFAYWGFGDGWEADAKYIQHLWDNLENIAVGVSFSKNASLYRHRTGCLVIKSKDKTETSLVESNLQGLIRSTISNTPSFGAEVLQEIFSDPEKLKTWKQELENARKDIDNRKNQLLKLLPKTHFQHWENSRGMFGLAPFSPEKVQELQDKYGIYMPSNGRINFAGLKTEQIPRLAEIFTEACEG